MFSKLSHIRSLYYTLFITLLFVMALVVSGVVIQQNISAELVPPTSTSKESIDYLNPGKKDIPDGSFKLTGKDGQEIITNVNDRNQFLRVGLDKVNEEFVKDIAPNADLQGATSIARLVVTWMNFFLSFYVVIAVLAFIYLGIRLLLSASSDDRRKSIIKMLTGLVIGTFLIICSYVLVRIIIYFVGGTIPS